MAFFVVCEKIGDNQTHETFAHKWEAGDLMTNKFMTWPDELRYFKTGTLFLRNFGCFSIWPDLLICVGIELLEPFIAFASRFQLLLL